MPARPVLLVACLTGLLSACQKTAPAKAASVPVPTPPVSAEILTLHVSPQGQDTNPGTEAQPLATVAHALDLLPASAQEKRILLAPGVYRAPFTVRPDQAGTGKLTIAAQPGAEVLFEGGQAVTSWQPAEQRGLFLLTADETDAAALEVWDETRRLRFKKPFDTAGVLALPGSACRLDARRVLIHPVDQTAPSAQAPLWINRLSRGLEITRPNTRIEGLRLRNFLGLAQARALTVSPSVTGAEIVRCRIENSTRGLSDNGRNTLVQECAFTDVGLGIVTVGRNLTVRDCVLLGASGSYATSDLNHHLRDGIRYYYPADGGLVTGCVTAGFWAGLYIKTDTAAPAAQPIAVEHNTFLDGIRAGSIGPQPKNRYLSNIIGTNEDGVDARKDPLLSPATFTDNLFLESGATLPFADLPAGDLTLQAGENAPGSAIRQIPPSAWLRERFAPATTAAPALAFLGEPQAVASETGALVSATITGEDAQAVLRYRLRGATEWQQVKSQPLHPEPPADLTEEGSPSQAVPSATSTLLFPLLRGEVLPHQAYEYELEVTRLAEKITSPLGQFSAQGGPRTWQVKPGVTTSDTFPTLQAALNHALPGDTVRLAPGVHTGSALLAHGGTEAHPVRIEGAMEAPSILDGGREEGVLLELRDAPYVEVRGLTFRWFALAGLSARNSPHLIVERSQFLNSWLNPVAEVNGEGISLKNSSFATIRSSLFTRLERGLVAMDSPHLTLDHNTAYLNLYTAAHLLRSAAGSRLTYNSFTFTGNDSLSMQENDLADLASLESNHNNFGSQLRATSMPRPENDFTPARRYGQLSQAKAILAVILTKQGWQRFTRLQDWRDYLHQDAASLFADPEYADPLHGDFRLQPHSPNILSQDMYIGAFPPVPHS